LTGTQSGILKGILATLIYGGTLLALNIWVSGGPRRFKDKYLVLISEKT
jgi:hypothetical protein